MGNLLFSPSGRISPDQFMKGAFVLIALGALISLSGLISPGIATILGIVGLVLIYCWVVLFIKRYHEGGKSGWMSLIPIIAYIVLSTLVTMLLFGGDMMSMFGSAMEAAQSGASSAETEAAMEAELAGLQGPGFVLKNTLAGIVVSLIIAWGFNKIIPVDPGPNQYGPKGEVFE